MSAKVDVAIEMPQEVAWATSRHLEDSGDVRSPASSSEPGTPPRDQAAARGFLGLLRAFALTAGGGGGDLLYVSLAITLSTVVSAFFVTIQYKTAVTRLSHGQSVFDAAAGTGFFGLMNLLMWAALAFSYVVGRRRFTCTLLSLRRCLERLAADPLHQKTEKQLFRREVTLLLAAAIGMAAVTTAVMVHMALLAPCGKFSLMCAVLYLSFLAFVLVNVSFHLLPMKFVFAGLHVNSGFRVINTGLKALLDGNIQLKVVFLDHLMSLEDELSQLFASLTNTMSFELIISMVYGSITVISLCIILMLQIRGEALLQFAPALFLSGLGAGVTVVLPCEMIQRILATLGQTRDLLLRTERHQPQLGQQLSLFRDTVGRDLDTLGDLGLFRLQRSTILSISATIITYIIVMVQFIGPEGRRIYSEVAADFNATTNFF